MNIILRCFAATCLVLFSLSALGDDDRRPQGFVMFNAGTLNVSILQLQINDPLNPFDDTPEPISIIEERSVGTLGRADLKTFAKVLTDDNGIPLEFDPRHCPDGFPIPVVITDDTVVLTFHDLSQLVGKGRTFVCIDRPGPGAIQGIRGQGHWSSGSRRFADVTDGKFYLSSTATPQSTNDQFYTTVGEISGRLKRK